MSSKTENIETSGEIKDLVVIDELDAAVLFQGDGVELDKVLTKVEKFARSFAFDITEKKDRAQMKSLAYKVSTSKTALTSFAKEPLLEMKARVDSVNKQCKSMCDRLDRLRDEVKQPLIDFEEKEKEILRVISKKIEALDDMLAVANSPRSKGFQIAGILETIKAVEIDGSYGDFQDRARIKLEANIEEISARLEHVQAEEKDKEELEQLRKESEERKKKDSQELLEKRAKEKAELEAEKKIEAEKQKAIDVKRESEEREAKAKKDQEAAEKRAEEAEKKAAQDKIDSDKKAAQDKIDSDKRVEEAKIQAGKDQEAAVKKEQDRIKAEEEARVAKEKEEEEKRLANQAHMKKYNGEILKALVAETGLAEIKVQEVIVAIATGKVPHVSVRY